MRRTCTALIVFTTLLLAVGSTGPAALAITSGPLDGPLSVDFNVQAVGVTTPGQTVTLTNNSPTSTPVTILSLDSNNGDYNVPGVSDGCTTPPTTLNPGDQCSFDVTFQPGSAGSDPGTLTITDDDTVDLNSTQTIDLNGAGVANQFSVSGPVTFPAQPVSTMSTPQAVTVLNNTDYSANPTNPTVTGPDAGDFGASGCTGGSVLGGGTCTVNVTFTPSATGSRTATLNVAGDTVSLSGTGVQAAANLTPGSTTFGNQPVATASAPKTITLKNTGSGPLTYASTTVSGADPADFSVGDTGCAGIVTVAPGSSCTVTVTFVPTAVGHRTATVVVHDSAPHPTQSVTVVGTGKASSMAFGPAAVQFTRAIPAGTGSPGHIVTVFNTTSASMPIKSTAITGTNPKNFIRTGDTCSGKTLAPGGRCTVKVRFAPSSAGRRTALLQINDSGPIAPHAHQVTLTGNSTYPNDPKSVAGAVGCSTAHISWVAPTATRFAGTIVVRNHARYPLNAGDGTRVPHTSGVATDRRLKHFTTYYYRVFATYHSLTHRGHLNYSRGARVKERTGQICSPGNGARTRDLTPLVTWLGSSTKRGYAFVLQRGSLTIDVNYTARTRYQLQSSWRWNKRTHRLARGHTYTFYLYAYPESHPDGLFIGKTTFTER